MSEQVSYVLFDASGEILSSGMCPPDLMQAQAYDGASLLAGEGARSTHFVSNGQIVAYTGPQAGAKAARPSALATWSNATMSWTDGRTLATIKTSRWDAIKDKRNAAEFGGFTWDGSAFDSDAMSQARIIGAVQMAALAAAASQSFSIDWTLSDNSVRTLSGADMIAVGLALGAHVTSVHTAGRGKRSAIDAASTAEAVEAVTW